MLVDSMKISVVYSPAPREVREWTLELPEGSKVVHALESCDIYRLCAELKPEAAVVGIWGNITGLSHVLRDGNRIEIYRHLRVDPKVARRERFSQQGVKGTGLFSVVRAGGKAGY